MVADDFTGAADTAVHFLRPGEEILLVSSTGDADLRDPPTAGMAIDTGTRGSNPEETVLEVRRAAGLVRRLAPTLVYKKLDSQLRGRPGLEIETLRREIGLPCAFVAPAHPDQDRVTRGGVHFVRGVPVADAEPGVDPVAPAMESRLPVLVAAQAGVEVGHVLLRDVEGGPDVLSARIRGFMDEGTRAITFDAVTRGHLELVAEVASSRFPDALLAGSAGLAMALAARLRTRHSPAAAMPRCGSMLFVCGSTAQALRRQTALLVASGRCRAETMSPSGVTSEPCRDALRQAAVEAWAASDVLLQTPEDRLDRATCPPSTLLAALADLALALVARRRPDGIFLSGGDTARALLGAAGVTAVRLRGEVLPGAPWGVAAGGTLDGAKIVTRAGAFGGDEDLVELHRRCREGARHD